MNQNLLNKKTNMIQVVCGEYNTYTTYNKAVKYITEGRGYIANKNKIIIPLNKKEFRNYILERDNYTCFYCGKYGDTIDHITPKSKGGISTPKNCVCACSKCNNKKGSKLLKVN